MTEIEALNRALFLRINGNDTIPIWLIQIADVIANDLIYLIPLLLLGMWLKGDSRYRNQAIKACLVALLALGANQLIGLTYSHPRPFMIGLGHTWTSHAPDSSFPSDHVTILTSIGLVLLFGGIFRLATAVLLLDLAVAWARVFVGVHFPLDMIGAVGVACAAYVVTLPLWRIGGDALTAYAERIYRKIFSRPITSGWVRR